MAQPTLPILRWNLPTRAVVFALSATSIWCLLAEFYGLCSMRAFTFAVLLPATAALIVLGLVDRVAGEGLIWRGMIIGGAAGLLAAMAYDLFRLPFVLAATDQMGPAWLRMPLFKVFPRFGAMILGEPFDAGTTDSQFTLFAHLIGWAYHLSNGITFGIMYIALVGEVTRRTWAWAVLFATGLELALLLTPYTSYFGLPLTVRFVLVTFAAHAIFGAALGLIAKQFGQIWPKSAVA